MKNLRNAIVSGVLAAVVIGGASPSSAGTKLWELNDPRGDDHGDGRLLYPTSSDFTRGDLDLIKVEAEQEKDGTTFELTFARPIRQPGRGAADELGTPMNTIFRYGFYTFNVDIYVDRDRQPGSGAIALLPGRKAEVAPDFGWERAVCLTPSPHEAREHLSRLVLRALRLAQGDDVEPDPEVLRELKRAVPADLESHVFFPNRVRVRGNTVSLFVPEAFLGGPAQPSWAYVIVVSGSDSALYTALGSTLGLRDEEEGRLMILPIAPGSWSNRFGGGREAGALQPPLVDLVVPAGASQEALLRDFDSRSERPVVLPGVVPAEVKQ